MNKYRNKKTVVDGITFDSRKEADYYRFLKQKEKDGEISDLRLQVKYEIVPPVKMPYVKKFVRKPDEVRYVTVQPAVHYVADFVYIDNKTGVEEVVDVKGWRTKEYILKRKMMRAFKGIAVIEV